MRSAKSVKRKHITKHAYQNKSHKKISVKKAMFSCKEWKKTTYSSKNTGTVIDFVAVAKQNTFYNVPEQINEIKKGIEKTQPKEEHVKEQPKKKVVEQGKEKVKVTKKSELKVKVKPEQKVETKVEKKNEKKVEKKNEKKVVEKVEAKEKVNKVENIPEQKKKITEPKKEVVENPLTVDVSTKVDNAGMKASVDSGIDFNNTNHSTGSTSPQVDKSGSPSRASASGNSFFESVSKIVETALESAESKPYSKLQINHSGSGRQRTHKLLPRDVKFCVKMLEKFGDDFESMSKSEDNVYMDTPSGIKRKIRIFKESPYYEQWKKGKSEGKSIDEILSC
uniref:Nucleolar protein 16 n=1 Tax=Strongyloides stercoralis TaxID=6248 RepID=A0A0K0EN36_STRER